MKRIMGVGLALAIAAAIVVGAAGWAASSSGVKVFTFGRLVGVSGAFLGSSMPLRGVSGGGLPWVIAQGQAIFFANGRLVVEVNGLVIDPANLTAQKRGIAGTNPVPFFFATLSCLDNTGATVNTNTTTAAAATSTGNATMVDVLTPPSPCFAPIVLVRGSTTGAPSGPWFAASGF